MTNKEKSKHILKDLLSQILEDDVNLKSFVFFFNKLENISIPREEIQQILENYLVVCSEEIIKGKKRVQHINDKYIFYDEQHVSFIDAEKIEIIVNAVRNNTGARFYISIHDFERRYKKPILRNGKTKNQYRDLIKQYQEGDTIEEIVSPYRTWKQLCNRATIVLTRNREFVCGIHKSMS